MSIIIVRVEDIEDFFYDQLEKKGIIISKSFVEYISYSIFNFIQYEDQSWELFKHKNLENLTKIQLQLAISLNSIKEALFGEPDNDREIDDRENSFEIAIDEIFGMDYSP